MYNDSRHKPIILPGGIASTANDMAQWMKMLLADGLNDAGEEVFSSERHI